MRVLVTGGAGYIGSHTVRHLLAAGHQVVVYDNLSTGFAWAVAEDALLVRGDLADEALLAETFARHDFDAVLHFAAHTVVPESVSDPLRYYANNTLNTWRLLQAAETAGVGCFVFSSTAAVYGMPERMPIDESVPLAPINPYGASKMMSERMLMDLGAAGGPRYVSLRYFNVAGADPAGALGQATPQATHLIKVACEAAVGQRDGLTVFGGDYPTADGTCVRDYIHVDDLARAHVQALDHLAGGGASEVLNCGYGRGYSVMQVIETVKALSGVDFPVRMGERRAGDPGEVVADNSRILRTLAWRPRYDNLETIVGHALAWERDGLPRRRGRRPALNAGSVAPAGRGPACR